MNYDKKDRKIATISKSSSQQKIERGVKVKKTIVKSAICSLFPFLALLFVTIFDLITNLDDGAKQYLFLTLPLVILCLMMSYSIILISYLIFISRKEIISRFAIFLIFCFCYYLSFLILSSGLSEIFGMAQFNPESLTMIYWIFFVWMTAIAVIYFATTNVDDQIENEE